jgi:nicotinamidase-related amidase
MPGMSVPRFQLERTALLVVDMQERLVPKMHEAESLVQRAGLLIDGANALGCPVLMTEQYRKGLGLTVPELRSRLELVVLNQEKTEFSACVEPIHDALLEQEARSVLVAGVEAHVCVALTCLDLVDRGFVVGVVADAISSRRPMDAQVAMQRMAQAGVVPVTVESVLLEMVKAAGTDRFKSILPLIK